MKADRCCCRFYLVYFYDDDDDDDYSCDDDGYYFYSPRHKYLILGREAYQPSLVMDHPQARKP